MVRPNIISVIFFVFVVFIFCFPLKAEEYREKNDFITRRLKGVYSIVTTVDIEVSGSSLTDLLVCVPYPESCAYQDIIWQNAIDPSMIAIFPETEEKFIRYARYQENQPSKTIKSEFIFRCWSVEANLEMVKEIYPYDKSSSIWKKFTRKPEGDNLQINPSNAWIVAQRDIILKQTKNNVLEYAREAYALVASEFSYIIDEPDLETIISQRGGQCGGLTAVVVSLLRANGIPSRTLVCKRPSGSNHVFGEFYLQNYGWVPFDVTNDIGKTGNYKHFGVYNDSCIVMTRDMHQGVTSERGRKIDIKLLQSYSWWYWYWGAKVSASVKYSLLGDDKVSVIPKLSSKVSREDIMLILEGSADAKLAENIKTAAEYSAYRTWALGLAGVTPDAVKASPNAWLSYALVTDKLIEGEVTESRLKVTSFKLSGENNLFSIKLKIDDVDVGDAATVENLLKIFTIEGTKELSGDSFSVNNLALDVVQINEGEVEFVVTPREKGRSFFFRARMRDNINGVGMNSFSDSHEKVQLWEGGPYWATTNIGAEKPEDYGYYFWWGDTVGYKRENDKWVASDGSNSNFSFRESNTPAFGKSISTLQSDGWIISKDGTYVLAPEYDAAQTHWGGDWRMPTSQELDDLNSKCDWTWGTMNGVNGYIVRGRGCYASNSIFLPCVGRGDGPSLGHAGSRGYYWSSVPDSDGHDSWNLYFTAGGHYTYDYRRFYGQSVRPLQGFTK